MSTTIARFGLGQIVRHRQAAFRGVVVDVDPVFRGQPQDTGAISPNQPFYQVMAMGAEGGFMAYAPEDALEHDPGAAVLTGAEERRMFNVDASGRHAPKAQAIH
ncbi:heat shock protein HspQ [Brevundimonas lenta]|uniref:Heat shock protein HspQ n=1 Tax=Brevundimonas lenta TaxID=424796 RepID=A0A7W6JG31_9CAUL|nr:heat shock protein HspQ [Brevundimonas lenta]MBB4083488.1 heat shock protein HspQ [Brevundimonas lenta]